MIFCKVWRGRCILVFEGKRWKANFVLQSAENGWRQFQAAHHAAASAISISSKKKFFLLIGIFYF